MLLKNEYSKGILKRITLTVYYPDSSSVNILNFVSKDGENFENYLESRKDNNGFSLYSQPDQRQGESDREYLKRLERGEITFKNEINKYL